MPSKGSALSRYLAKALGWLGLLGALFIAATAVWTVKATRTYTYQCRLVTPAGVPDAQDLDDTVRVLSDRLKVMRRKLKLSSGRVSAEPPDAVRLELRARDEPVEALAWLLLPGHVELRLLHPVEDVIDQVGPEGLEARYEVRVHRSRHYVLSRPGDLETTETAYALERQPVLATDGFEEVSIQTVGLHKMAVLTFRFRPEDADDLARATALHAGRRMAMLIDGEMFFPPRKIPSAAQTPVMQAQGYFYMPPLRKLVQLLSCGSLPGRLVRLDEPAAEAGDAPADGPP